MRLYFIQIISDKNSVPNNIDLHKIVAEHLVLGPALQWRLQIKEGDRLPMTLCMEPGCTPRPGSSVGPPQGAGSSDAAVVCAAWWGSGALGAPEHPAQ